MAVNSDDFAALEKRLSSKSAATKEATAVQTKKPEVKVQAKKPEVKVQKAAPVAVKSTPAPVKAAPVKAPVVQKVAAPAVTKASVVASPAPSALSGGEVVEGVLLGLSPFLILPVVLAAAVKPLLALKPKPLPVPETPKVKVQPYSKPLNEGAKEGKCSAHLSFDF
jgi:hypothetical protein